MPRQPLLRARASRRPGRHRVRQPRRPVIVCAVAGVEEAEYPVAVARELAERLEDELVLVHVAVPPPPLPRSGALGVDPRQAVEPARLETAARSVLDTIAARLHLEAVRRRPLVGDPATAVLDVAEELDADLIVVGSRRHGRFVTALLGSVSREIADATDRPVVVVPTARDHAHLIPVRCVVCGVDGSPESRRALLAARDLAERLRAKLVLASAQVSVGEGLHLLGQLAQAEDLPSNTGLRVRFGSPAEVLEHVAAEEDAALVVVGRRGGLLKDLLRGSVSATLHAYAHRILVLA